MKKCNVNLKINYCFVPRTVTIFQMLKMFKRDYLFEEQVLKDITTGKQQVKDATTGIQ